MASIVSTASLVSRSYNKPCLNLNSKTATAATTSFGTRQRLTFSSGVGFSRKTKTDVVVVKAEAQPINPQIRKTEAKVVDSVVVTELEKAVNPYCRCWRSGTFPLCDGSHVKHNKETGDNVGPLLLKK